MKAAHAALAVASLALGGTVWAQANPEMPEKIAQATSKDQQAQQDLKAMEKEGLRNDMPPMTVAQQTQYKAEYEAAKAKWAALTPQQKQATIAAARTKKLSELSAMELVGQRDDMQRETAAQSAEMRAEAQAAKAKWDKLSPAQKQALRKSAWQKKRADLDGMEAVGQRDDTYVVPW